VGQLIRVVRRILTITLGLLLGACTSSPSLTTQNLPSGKTINLLGIGTMYLTEDSSIDDVDLLRKDVEEIWPMFRVNVEESELSNAIIAATSPPETTRLIFSTSRSHNFVSSKKENGTWDFNSWNRDYDNEAQKIAEPFLENLKMRQISNAVDLLHYPDSFTPEQMQEETRGVSTVLSVVPDKLGAITSYQIRDSRIPLYRHFTLFTASQEYWNRYPYFNALIYDVEYSKKGSGYMIFRFSIIDDKLVINSLSYCLPDSTDAQTLFEELNEDIRRELGV